MTSLQWRLTLWFTGSLLAVLAVYVGVTNAHLEHELRIEKWERAHPGHSDWTLHANFTDAEIDDIAGELRAASLIYAVPVAALALVIGYYLARRSLQPVNDISQQLQTIGANSLHKRVALATGGEDFRRIETNLNALLGRLDESFRQLTEFSAQVAHELRTPLTLLRLQVEEAAGRIEPALAESLQEELHRLSDYVDQCLLLATAEQGRLKLELSSVPLRSLVSEMIEVYELLARAEDRTLTVVSADEITVTADERLLRQMLHNLLTNALRHGIGDITVNVERENGVSRCRIRNAVNPKPGSNAPGTGLGLRIIRALTALHPKLDFSTHNDGGTYTADLTWR